MLLAILGEHKDVIHFIFHGLQGSLPEAAPLWLGDIIRDNDRIYEKEMISEIQELVSDAASEGKLDVLKKYLTWFNLDCDFERGPVLFQAIVGHQFECVKWLIEDVLALGCDYGDLSLLDFALSSEAPDSIIRLLMSPSVGPGGFQQPGLRVETVTLEHQHLITDWMRQLEREQDERRMPREPQDPLIKDTLIKLRRNFVDRLREGFIECQGMTVTFDLRDLAAINFPPGVASSAIRAVMLALNFLDRRPLVAAGYESWVGPPQENFFRHFCSLYGARLANSTSPLFLQSLKLELMRQVCGDVGKAEQLLKDESIQSFLQEFHFLLEAVVNNGNHVSVHVVKIYIFRVGFGLI